MNFQIRNLRCTSMRSIENYLEYFQVKLNHKLAIFYMINLNYISWKSVPVAKFANYILYLKLDPNKIRRDSEPNTSPELIPLSGLEVKIDMNPAQNQTLYTSTRNCVPLWSWAWWLSYHLQSSSLPVHQIFEMVMIEGYIFAL